VFATVTASFGATLAVSVAVTRSGPLGTRLNGQVVDQLGDPDAVLVVRTGR
jgi:hypothetical protein